MQDLFRGVCAALFLLVLAGPGAPRAAERHKGHSEEKHVLDTSRKNMKRIARSLGVECTHCHVARKPNGHTDFKAMSPMKETAIYMKVHFVDSLKTREGTTLACVSCHNGHARFLPRKMKNAKPSNLLASGSNRQKVDDRMKRIARSLGVKCDFCHVRGESGDLIPDQPTPHKLIAKYMMDHYAGTLVSLSGVPVTCVTCHHGKAQFLPRSETQAK